MAKSSILFQYTIKNRIILDKSETIVITEDNIRIKGIQDFTAYTDNILRPFRYKKALLIDYQGNEYGNEFLSVSQLLAMLNICCIADPLNNRLHSIEHAIEFE